jgi:electron transfer flavoprotein beta subunit
VPAPGARINLTADRRAIDARHLSFTVSPHEECGVEEAIRLRESHGGSVTVLTLGPSEAEEQLRYALSVGADQAELIVTDGEEWDPQSTANALAARIKDLELAGGEFELIIFGNESADTGGYQVGIRVAHLLERPIITGIKGLQIENGEVIARREVESGFEVYRLPMPALIAVKEGINLPRYPTLPGRLKAKKAEVANTGPGAAIGGGLQMQLLRNPPEQQTVTKSLGTGAEAAAAVVDLFEELGLLR